jgi:hypothetical protein
VTAIDMVPEPFVAALPAVPRRVVRRTGRSLHPIAAAAVLAAPFFFWANMVCEGGVKLALGTLGRTAPAEIVRTSYAYTAARASRRLLYSDLFTCEYRVGGRTYTIRGSRSRSLPKTGPPAVAYFDFAPTWQARLVFPDRSVARDGGEELAFSGALGLFFGLFAWALLVIPARERRLIATGEAVVGRVIEKHAADRNGMRGSVRVEFQPAGADPGLPPVQCTSYHSGAAWFDMSEGKAVTVFYDPARPQHCVPYPAALYAIEGNAPPLRDRTPTTS